MTKRRFYVIDRAAEGFDHPVTIDPNNKIAKKFYGKAGTNIVRNLDYHGIARRATKEAEKELIYDRDIDISGVCLKK